MSQNFLTAPAPYVGSFVPKPITLCVQSDEKPSCVTIEIDWQQPPYNRGAVMVDITVQGPANPIKNIRSILIDNTSNNTAVSVRFDDTRDTVPCLPFSTLRVPVLTSSLQFQVFAPGINAQSTSTRIFVTNVYLDPLVSLESSVSVAQWQSSSLASNANLYDAPALGDLSTSAFISMAALTQTQILPARASGFYFITHVSFFVVGCYRTDVAATGALSLEANGGAIMFFPNFIIKTDMEYYPRRKIFSQERANIRAPANVAYMFRNYIVMATGFGELVVNYTYEPQ